MKMYLSTLLDVMHQVYSAYLEFILSIYSYFVCFKIEITLTVK